MSHTLYVLFQPVAATESHDAHESPDLASEELSPEDKDTTGEEPTEQPEPDLDTHPSSSADTEEAPTTQSAPNEVIGYSH